MKNLIIIVRSGKRKMYKIYAVCHQETLGSTIVATFADENDAREMYVDLALEEMHEAFNYYLKMENVKRFCGYPQTSPLSDIEIALKESELANDYFILEIPYFPIESEWRAKVFDPHDLPVYVCQHCRRWVRAGDDRNWCPQCGASMKLRHYT